MMTDLVKRLLSGVITLFVVVSLTFFLMRVLPGGPFDQERKLPPAIQANLEAKYHLDAPLGVQYVSYLNDLLHGDMGPSYKYLTRRVNDIVWEGVGVSFLLGLLALLLGTLGGVVLGTWAGMTRSRPLDAMLSMVGVASISTPGFIFGALLVMVFAYGLNCLPAARLTTPQHLILPVLTLSLTPFAYTFLLIRTAVREVRMQPFIAIKQAFGIADLRVAVVHVLRNAMMPLLSILGPMAAMLLTGSFAVEWIFAVPGLGKYFVTAVSNRDYTLVMGITMVYSALLIVLNVLTDLVYSRMDPRLRQQAGGDTP